MVQRGLRGVGLGAFENQEKYAQQCKELGQDLIKTHSEHLSVQLSAFKAILAEFSRKYRRDIHSNPSFRSAFSQMCRAIGIDPLASTGSKKRTFWSDMLDIRDFYFGLSVQIIELCRRTRRENGGLIELQYALQCINEIRLCSGGTVVSEEDILQSIKTLDILASGFKVIRIGQKDMICSLPNELNPDQFTVLNIAQVLGYVSFTLLRDNLQWDVYRISNVIEDLLSQSLLWVDEQAEELEFWLPHVFLYLPSTNVNLALRNTPTMIWRRTKAVLCLCIICGLSTAWLTQPPHEKFLPHFLFILGFWPCRGQDIIRSLTLVLCLFWGPFIKRILFESKSSIPMSPTAPVSPTTSLLHTDHSIKYWIGWRNYVVGPFSEEFVFRSCMIPLLYHMSISKTIIITSLLFGAAHVHHLYEYYRSHPNYIMTGILIYFFQFFYTAIFGGFVSYLYLRNWNFWSIVIVHSFCNWMGFPQLYGSVDASKLKTIIYYIMLWFGVIGFIVFFKPLTQSSMTPSFA
ncbi:hypothetical protein PORY_002658 [Pneumocystis oryctolagi]|uniref:Uncharacterized protein n=1 Tax=Pneumocystis oryctolagi TaxID=42067 RepID=A0ACB7CAT1_9ASCO|nr:hypothetical protein PORY_002658 [Pneumocystis oryctolagi]